MSKHTRGPWIVGKPLKNTAQIPIISRIIATDADTGIVIALVTDHHGASYCPDAKANARLIAAAPELLASLKALAVMIEHAPFELQPTELKILETAVQRIAKAEHKE